MKNTKNQGFNFMEDSEDEDDFDDYNKLNISSEIKKEENKKIYNPGKVGLKLKDDLINLFKNIINIIEGMEFRKVFKDDFEKICQKNLKVFENIKTEKKIKIENIGIVKIDSENIKDEIFDLKKNFSKGLEKNFLIMRNLINNIDDINLNLENLIKYENINIKEKIKTEKLGKLKRINKKK